MTGIGLGNSTYNIHCMITMTEISTIIPILQKETEYVRLGNLLTVICQINLKTYEATRFA